MITAKKRAAAAGTWSPTAPLAAAEVVDAGAVDVADAEPLEPVLGIVLEAAAEDGAAWAELTMGNTPDEAYTWLMFVTFTNSSW